ncbi:MAG: plastocyanin/azurin family copper-binding protein [Verrucomicrobiales bacterium]|nr:plastocyanin/azurin family copper-binding protein [Verrucomicrobiales bacterium]
MKIKSMFLAVAALTISATGGLADEAHEVKITADKTQFLYDVKEFTVKPGQKVKIILVNPADSVNRQPHNLLIVKPGKKDVVGMASNAGLSDPTFLTEKNAVPDSEDILFHSKLIQPGQEDILEFTAPEEAGDYPYLCTYPGHWAIMNGVMKVAE